MTKEEFWNKWSPFNYHELGHGYTPDRDSEEDLMEEMLKDLQKVIKRGSKK